MNFDLIPRAIPKSKARTCPRCNEPVLENAPSFRLRHRLTGTENSRPGWDFHPQCAVDCSVAGMDQTLRRDGTLFEGRHALTQLINRRSAVIQARRTYRWDSTFDPENSMFRNATPPRFSVEHPHPDLMGDIPFVQDHRGRPRVRVLCAGPLFVGPTKTQSKLYALLQRGGWASSRCEYEFVSSLNSWTLPEEDPAVPFVATLYGSIAHHKTQECGLNPLFLWRSLHLPPPLLWLIGVTRNSTKDRYILSARETVDRFGFDPDQCPVLTADTMDETALDALVQALDEHFAARIELTQSQETTIASLQYLREQLIVERIDRVHECFSVRADSETATGFLQFAHSTEAETLMRDCIDRLTKLQLFAYVSRLLQSLIVRDAEHFHGQLRAVLDQPEVPIPPGLGAMAYWYSILSKRYPMDLMWSAMQRTTDEERFLALAYSVINDAPTEELPELQRRLQEMAEDSRAPMADSARFVLQTQELRQRMEFLRGG